MRKGVLILISTLPQSHEYRMMFECHLKVTHAAELIHAVSYFDWKKVVCIKQVSIGTPET